MSNYSQQELVDMVYTIGESSGNCLLASRCYLQKYPDRRHPDARAFANLKERFDRTGSVTYEKVTRSKTVLHMENQLSICLAVQENPETSVRKISKQLDICKSSVSKCLKLHKYHPYRIQLHQELTENDYERRIEFCTWAQNNIRQNGTFFNNVLFTDESTFHRNGFVNRHNYHYYDTANPHKLRMNSFQHKWSLNVWGGIIGAYVIGPHFFEERLTGTGFLEFLQNDFPRLIEHLPDAVKNNMWLQLDGASVHFQRAVRSHLDNTFPDRWIGRSGPVAWPARSPDVTPMDFFKWGFIKSEVYRTEATTRDDMKERIRQAFRQITPQMLQNVRRSFAERLHKCISENGRHFEHLLH